MRKAELSLINLPKPTISTFLLFLQMKKRKLVEKFPANRVKDQYSTTLLELLEVVEWIRESWIVDFKRMI